MRILIIRHGDPDYTIDGLTEKGQKEAALLADRLAKEPINAVYCSTMGRARLTAAPTLQQKGLQAEYCDWLREVHVPKIEFPYQNQHQICWDLLPEQMDQYPALYSPAEWKRVDFIQKAAIPAIYDRICTAFDAVLAAHGYRRDGLNYQAKPSSRKTLAFFCHYGLAGVLLSHLMNCSPYTLWQNAFLPPTSVTTFYTEERVQGIASFRCSGMGDISHLYAEGEPASFSGRYCECFDDDTRH